MKRFLIVLCLFALTAGLAWAEGPKCLIRASGLSDKEMKNFLAGEYDVARTGPRFAEVVVTQDELAGLKKTGMKIAVLIPDLDAYVATRLEQQTPQAAYFNYDSMTATLQAWAQKYSNIASLTSIGKSIEGREIWALKVSDNPDLDEKEPACFVNGTIHAREWIGVEVAMETLRQILEGYGTDERFTRMVDEREIWIIPLVNPDGYFYSQNKQKYWRKNRRDNNGKDFGVDLNRNFGYKWGGTGASSSPYSDTYRGKAAFSEPETAALRDLAEKVNFQTSLSYHSYSELVLYPFAYEYNVPNPDVAIFKQVGAEMAAFNKYTVQNCTELYPCSGVSDDYFYGVGKTIAFTFEIGQEFIPPASEIAELLALNVPATLVLIERTAAIAVNTPSGNPEMAAHLDLEDGLAALELGKGMLPRFSGDARERVAANLQAAAQRVAELTVDGLRHGDSSAWQRLQATPSARPALGLARTRALFEHCHGTPLPPQSLALIQAAR